MKALSAGEIVWDSFMIDSLERNALFCIPSVCLQALCRKSYDAWALILYYNALEWKRKVFAVLEKSIQLSKIKKNQNSLTVLMSRFAVKELWIIINL